MAARKKGSVPKEKRYPWLKVPTPGQTYRDLRRLPVPGALRVHYASVLPHLGPH
jgi:hypothetical protein